MIENEITCLTHSAVGWKQYGIPTTYCVLAGQSQSECIGTNEYGAIRPRGASLLSVSPFAFVSRQEAPYPAAAASGGYHGDAQRAARAKFLHLALLCSRLITIFHCFCRAIVHPSQRKSTAKIKRKGIKTLLASVFSGPFTFFAAQRSRSLCLFFDLSSGPHLSPAPQIYNMFLKSCSRYC
jgi:hypothetical protein